MELLPVMKLGWLNGHSDHSLHLKAHARGTIGLIALSALLALIPAYLY